MGMVITHQQALNMLRQDVASHRTGLHRYFTPATIYIRLPATRDAAYTSLDAIWEEKIKLAAIAQAADTKTRQQDIDASAQAYIDKQHSDAGRIADLTRSEGPRQCTARFDQSFWLQA